MQLWVDQICAVGVDAMISIDGQIRNLLKSNDVLTKKFFAKKNLSEDDQKIFCDQFTIVSDQLLFWTIQGNKERFLYDLKDHVRWMLKKYP